jgi:hypothetical protein
LTYDVTFAARKPHRPTWAPSERRQLERGVITQLAQDGALAMLRNSTEPVVARSQRAQSRVTCAVPFGSLIPRVNSRLTFCPEAIISASAFTFSSPLSLKRLKPCQSLASPKTGSTFCSRDEEGSCYRRLRDSSRAHTPIRTAFLNRLPPSHGSSTTLPRG